MISTKDSKTIELEERFWPEIVSLLKRCDAERRSFDSFVMVVFLPDMPDYETMSSKFVGFGSGFKNEHGTIVMVSRTNAREGLFALAEMNGSVERVQHFFDTVPPGTAIVAFAGLNFVSCTTVSRTTQTSRRGMA